MATGLVALAAAFAALGIVPATSEAAVYRFCGEGTYGRFEGSISGQTENVRTRNVQCPNAFRFAHKLYFAQDCVFCDGGYSYGWMRFRGFRCHVGPGPRSTVAPFYPQKFKCKRGGRRISFLGEAVFG